MNSIRYILLAGTLMLCSVSMAHTPRLIVNIVVGGMRASDLQRYEANFCAGGLRRMMQEGATFTECYADYAPTTSVAGLATIATGALPSTHGVISKVRFDRTSNSAAALCIDAGGVRSDVRHDIASQFQLSDLTAQTLSESALAHARRAKSITIAHQPLSAMVLAGRGGECYWMSREGAWTSATCYTDSLPSWVNTYNGDQMNRIFATKAWYGRYTKNRYRNTRTTDITIYEQGNDVRKAMRSAAGNSKNWVAQMHYTPSGNHALFEFAKRAISSLMPLHINDECKILNICLDTPRNIVEKYGPDSAEYEDMLYSLDILLGEFITYVYAQLRTTDDVLFTLTADHGTSPAQLAQADDATRFNARQFEVILNAFLSARYGQDKWVLGYADGSLYLNHDTIYRRKQPLAEVQNEAATFALQFRGVANAITATALRSGTMHHGTARLMQNGYCPRTSGDVVIVLNPERISLDSDILSEAGSPYNYDRHVPLLMLGGGVAPQRIERHVTTDQIAPTIAALATLPRPQCSYSERINDIKRK